MQGLRALAVIVVILNHMLGWPTGGFIGVDVFFVLSGYLITGLLLREHDRSGTISFTGFYKRRIKRIMPAAVLVLLVTVIASYVLTPGVRYLQTLNDSFWALIFSANWNMAIQGTDYFAQDQLPSPVQHYWSLAVEEQFYFVWPWLMLGILALGIKIFSWSTGARRAAVGVTIGVISIGSFIYAVYLTSTDLNLAYFSSIDRAWELGAGALVAVLGTYFTTKSVALRTVMSWVGLIAIIVSCFLVNAASGFPAPWAALPVLATALVLLAGEQGTQPFLWPLTNRVSQYVGDISYSLYLWHFPVLILLLAVIPGENLFYYLTATGIILLVSVVSYHFVEDPIRKSSWLSTEKLSSREKRHRKRKRREFLKSTAPKIGFVVLAGVVAVALLYVAFVRTDTSRSDLPADLAIGAVDEPPGETTAAVPDDLRCLGAASMDPASDCASVDLGSTLTPSAADAAGDKMTVNGKALCWIKTSGNLSKCQYGSDSRGAIRIAYVGDSHAQHLLPAILPELGNANWSLDAYTGEGCLLSTTPTTTCPEMQPKILEAVTSGDYDLVITQSSRTKNDSPEGFAEAFQRVVASGTPLAVIADVPSVTDETILCYQRIGFDPKNNDCATSLSASPTDQTVVAASAVPGVNLIDLTSLFCVDDRCPAVIGNVPVYRDSGAHLTSTYAETLAPYLMPQLLGLVATP